MTRNRCLLYVGALSKRKNYPFILDIYKNILRSEPDVKLVLVGKGNVSSIKRLLGYSGDDYYYKYFNRLTPSEKNGIIHIERIDNDQLQFIYPLAKAFLLPSKREIFGMVLLEALFLGTPVITSRNGGSETLIEGKETGIIIDNFDVKLWSNAVISILNNESERKNMTMNGKLLILSEYNWQRITEKILQNLKE